MDAYKKIVCLAVELLWRQEISLEDGKTGSQKDRKNIRGVSGLSDEPLSVFYIC